MAAGNAVVGALRVLLGMETASLESGAKRAKGGLGDVRKGVGDLEVAAGRLNKSMDALRAGLAGVVAGVTVGRIVQMADAWTSMSSQLRLVTASSADAGRAMTQLMGIAQESRVGIGATVDLFSRLSRSTQALGASQADVMRVTETISKALTISGTSAETASGALMQLGQAFASGAVRGDELNSVLEGMPRVAEAIADGMGVTVGQLRKLGTEGKLTSEQVFKALLEQSAQIESEFGQMSTTVGQAMTQLGNKLLEFVGYANESTEATGGLTEAIGALTDIVDGVREGLAAASVAFKTAAGDADDLKQEAISLGDVVGTVAEAIIVLGANVAYIIGAFVKDVKSLADQAAAIARLDFKAAQAEEDRRTAEAKGDRAAVDAFSASVIDARDVAASRRRKAEMDAASAAAARAQWGVGASGAGGGKPAATAAASADRATKATRGLSQAQRDAAKAAREQAAALERLRDQALTPTEKKTKDAAEAVEVLQRAFRDGKISADEMHRILERMDGAAEVVGVQLDRATTEGIEPFNDEMARGIVLAGDWVEELRRDLEKAAEGFYDVQDAIEGAYRALKNRDWVSVVGNIADAVKQLQAAFSSTGTSADKVSALGGVASGLGSIIGGKAGRALGSAGNAAVTAMALTGNPIVAGVAAATAGLAELLKSKPSNHGAGYDLTTGQITGGSRNADTERAAIGTGNAIRDAQDLLSREFGLTLGETIRGLVIGTRDQSQIYTSSGKTLYAAKGDPQAAVEEAMRAVLEGATYASAAQEKLVKSMLAAHRGFDEITQALQDYAAAQDLAKGVERAILGFVDPKAAAVADLQDQQAARRKAIQADLEAGYLTADAFAALTVRLKELEGLELNKVLEQFGDGVAGAADKLASSTEALAAAYSAQVSALSGNIADLDQIRSNLSDFFRELTTSGAGGLSPKAALADARTAFAATLVRAQGGDRLAQGDLVRVGKAYQSALEAGAGSMLELMGGLAEIKAGTAGVLSDVSGQQDAALRQLADINTSVLLVRDAILAVAGTANDNGFGLPGFAATGGFTVGGSGGIDSQVAAFKATPGEMVDVYEGSVMGDINAALEGLRADGRAEAAAMVARQTEMNRTLSRWDKSGLYVRGVAPGEPIGTVAA